MIITHLDAATQNLFRIAKGYYELSDDTLRPATKNNSDTELNFAKLRSGDRLLVIDDNGKVVGLPPEP